MWQSAIKEMRRPLINGIRAAEKMRALKAGHTMILSEAER
jgi:hypothetical protein